MKTNNKNSILEHVKKQKKAEFVVDWNVDNYYAEYKDKDFKEDDLSNSMKEALLKDGGYVSNSPVKVWNKSLFENPKWISISNSKHFNKNKESSIQDQKILPGNHVVVTGFEENKDIIRDRRNKINKEDMVSIKKEFKNSDNQFSVMDYDNINIPFNIMSEWDHVREILTLFPLIIAGIICVIYNLKRLLFYHNYIFFNYIMFMNIKNRFIYSKYNEIIKNN